MLLNRITDNGCFDIFSEVDDIKAVALKDDLNDILTDIMNVSLDRRDYDRSLSRRRNRLDILSYLIENQLRGFSRYHKLRQEDLALIVVINYFIKCRDK